jgi:DNA-binding beta-propeller fold protein YncE
LNGPLGVAVDAGNNELFVANSSAPSVTVYDLSANGNVAPKRTLSGGLTGLNSPYGIAVDTVNNELFVAIAGGATRSVTVYARTASGNVAPLRTLTGAATGLIEPTGLAVDTANNELLVADAIGHSVMVYLRTANGNTAPLRTIAVATSGNLQGLAVDTVNNELALVNGNDNSVSMYTRTASGSAVPLRIISGAATGLVFPIGVVVDTVNNELLVANDSAPSVTVYTRTANGNAAPLRTIAGVAGFSSPTFLALGTGALAPSAAVPTLDARGLIALTLILAAIGIVAIRRMIS